MHVAARDDVGPWTGANPRVSGSLTPRGGLANR